MTERSPDFCEAITAWRLWIVRGGDYVPWLTGVGAGFAVRWPAYEALEARHMERERAPFGEFSRIIPCESPCDLLQGCGVYGHKSAALMAARIIGYRNTFWYEEQLVIGEVSLWGRIVEHETGYRAQVAYPKRLVYGHACDGAVVAAQYGIPFEEDSVWKSVIQYAALQQNPSFHQYLSGYSPIHPRSFQAPPPTPQASPRSRTVPLLVHLNSYRFSAKEFEDLIATAFRLATSGPVLPPRPSRYARRRAMFGKKQAP
jgi:hypothetical protein